MELDFSPDHERIVENSAVHSNGAVNFRVNNGGGSDNHALCQVMIFAFFGNLPRETQIVVLKFFKASGERNVAGADLAFFVFNNGVHGD